MLPSTLVESSSADPVESVETSAEAFLGICACNQLFSLVRVATAGFSPAARIAIELKRDVHAKLAEWTGDDWRVPWL